MKLRNRWSYAVIGVAVMLIVGMVYGWSILSAPIASDFPEWSKTQLSFTFTLTMIGFCCGCLVSGALSKKISPRGFVCMAAVMLAIGFFLTAATQNLPMLYLGFGVLGGVAGGFAYNNVLCVLSAWFPDKQGLISGILLMGFGISSFLIGKLYVRFLPEGPGGWRIVFRVLAVIALVVVLVCGLLLREPDEEDRKKMAQSSKKARPSALESSTGEMIRQSSFWLYFIYAVLVSVAGLALVSQASGIAWEIGPQISAGTIATIVGLISVFNGIGRVFFGALYDKKGYRATILTDFILFLAEELLLLGAFMTGNFVLLVIGFIFGGLAYGAVTPTNSAIISDFFGRRHYAMNLSVINVTLMIASVGSTVAGKLYDNSGSYYSTIFMMLAVTIVGGLVSLRIRRPGEASHKN